MTTTDPLDALQAALRIHHPIMRSETGPFSGCRCGEVKLGQDVIAHVVTQLRAAQPGELRDALAEALEERFGYAVSHATVDIDWDEEADALLPVFTAYAERP